MFWMMVTLDSSGHVCRVQLLSSLSKENARLHYIRLVPWNFSDSNDLLQKVVICNEPSYETDRLVG